MKNALLIFSGILMLGLASCDSKRHSSGPYTTEYRSLDSDYQELIVDGYITVEIIQNADFDVKVESGERRLPYIKTDAANGKLRIYEENNRVIKDKAVRVVVNKSYFEKIELDGSGDIIGANIIANDMDLILDGSGDMDLSFDALETLNLELDGSGDVELHGDAFSSEIDLDGSGDVDARYLYTDDVEVILSGSGDIEVTAL
ncbi:MAG: DUF2807 domain-containing protein, partial [Flavobacteriales bacterium]|nr:DUF2807 domain-containing protein [Flavobacteriales bacterium]